MIFCFDPAALSCRVLILFIFILLVILAPTTDFGLGLDLLANSLPFYNLSLF